MADIKFVWAAIYTSESNAAGTGSGIYLCIGGRGFKLGSSQDDFETGNVFSYFMGGAAPQFVRANVNQPDRNDPRGPLKLTTDALADYPAYLRH
jgi:hypothetical protein